MRTMQQPKLIWLGFATLGMMALGCTDDGGTEDEIGGSTDDTTSSTGEESSDSGTTTEESTGSTDASTETTDATATDTTDTTDTTDATDTTGGGDFALIEAAFADDFGTLVLTFNDAVAPVDAVDPADFRISMALSMSVNYMGMQYDVSYYSDPNVYVDYEAMPIGMMAIANGPNADQISLTLAPVFNVDACAELEYALTQVPPEATADGHFFPHYAAGNIPVTSEGGTELAAIGPDWVLNPENYVQIDMSGWPNLDPQIPIPCP